MSYTGDVERRCKVLHIRHLVLRSVQFYNPLTRSRGARAVFLPAYSPDLNPIEQLFARLKSFLRKMKARTVEKLWKAIASFLKGVSKDECKAYLANSGYT